MLKITHRRNDTKTPLSKISVSGFIDRNHLIIAAMNLLYFDKKVTRSAIENQIRSDLLYEGLNGIGKELDESDAEYTAQNLGVDDLREYATGIIDRLFPQFKD